MADQSLTPRIGIFDFIENHLPYKTKFLLKLAIPIILIIGGILLYNWISDLRARDAQHAKELATLNQQFQQLGSSAVTHNELQTTQQATQIASQQFGQEVMNYMKQNNSRLDSLTTAVGTINGAVNGLQKQTTTFQPVQQNSTNGALTGFPLEENRGSLPATSSINLFYDPTQKDPNLAFRGTQWTHYTEIFHPVVGEWQQNKTGGFKTTLKLTRDVMKPDPIDPTKMIKIGTEDIPITEADTIYTPKGLGQGNGFISGHWTATLGVSKDASSFNSLKTSGGYQLMGLLDYRVTNKFGLTFGTANRAGVVGLSIRIGGSK